MLKKSHKRKRRRKKNLAIKFVIIVASILIVFFIIAVALFLNTIGKVNREEISSENVGANAVEEQYQDMRIKNIALFGTDSRENIDGGRSDTIMIASVNPKSGVVKLISIARDTYVEIPEHGSTRINHAYSYGGAELAVKTLNTNFGLDITDFVSVNFDQLQEIIDILGGIDVEVTENELSELNRVIGELGGERVYETGIVHLDGTQTLAFSRIRYNDSDAGRTERQRMVMECIFNKLKTMPSSRYPSVVSQLMPYVTTSLSTSEILDLSRIAVTKDITIETDGIPNEYISYKGGTFYGIWCYLYDIDTAADMIKKFIYDDIPFSEYAAETGIDAAGSDVSVPSSGGNSEPQYTTGSAYNLN